MTETYRIRTYTNHTFDFISAPITQIQLSDIHDSRFVVELVFDYDPESIEAYVLTQEFEAFPPGSWMLTNQHGVDVLIERMD